MMTLQTVAVTLCALLTSATTITHASDLRGGAARGEDAGPCGLVFGNPQFRTGDAPTGVAAGDLDGDGDDDVAVASQNGGVSVLINSGDGTFAPEVTYPAGEFPTDLVIGDVDGVNGPDLIVVSATECGGVCVLRNNGDGTFGEDEPVTVGCFPFSVATGDLDGDDDFDIAVSIFLGNDIEIHLNDGNGTFTFHDRIATGFVGELVLSDLDDDEDLDIAMAAGGGGDGGVVITLNEGDATFGSTARYGTGVGTAALAVHDLDGDDAPDLIVTDLAATEILVLKNDGAAGFDDLSTLDIGLRSVGVVIGDLDGDLDPDAAISTASPNLVVIRNDGNASFTRDEPYDVDPLNTFRNLDLADVDLDGDLDVVLPNAIDDSTTVLLNDGSGALGADVRYDIGESVTFVTTGDFDGDLDLDLAVTAVREGKGTGDDPFVSIRLNEGGVFVPHSTRGIRIARQSAAADLDRDGDLDLVVTDGADSLSVLMNEGDATFAVPIPYTAALPLAVAIADLNDDEWPDIVATSLNDEVSVLLNLGDGTFDNHVEYDVDFSPRGVAIADFNFDSIPDPPGGSAGPGPRNGIASSTTQARSTSRGSLIVPSTLIAHRRFSLSHPCSAGPPRR